MKSTKFTSFVIGMLTISLALPSLTEEDQNACLAACTTVRTSAVCGLNGQTYDTRCALDCHEVKLAFEGICSKCYLQRNISKGHDFQPACEQSTGLYSSTQCHSVSDYCWCVDTHNGKPVPGSSVKHRTPVCDYRPPKRHSRRHGSRKQKCLRSNRNSFTRDLRNMLTAELARQPSHVSKNSESAVSWKFASLDNGDGLLSRRELRHFRRTMRKNIRPRACVRIFMRTCDLNGDGRISRIEWSYCLGVDSFLEEDHPKPVDVVLSALSSTPPSSGIPFLQLGEVSTATATRKNMLKEVEEKVDGDDEGEKLEESGIELSSNCFKSRQKALQKVAKSSAFVFIPECDKSIQSRNRYNPVQCHKSTGYCWCVNTSNGHPIVGTSSYLRQPDCSGNGSRANSHFKGCPFNKKNRFLRVLLFQFKRESKIRGNSPDKDARWKFDNVNVNGNAVIEKREWKLLKRSLRPVFKKLKLSKCWRNFFTFCDLDANNKVSRQEWLQCCGKREQSRRGPNPFSTILKSD